MKELAETREGYKGEWGDLIPLKCNVCLEVCPPRFNAVVKVSGEEIEVPEEPIPGVTSK